MESAKGGWQHPLRTQQRITLTVKSPKFSMTKWNTKVALRGLILRGVSSNHVLSWAFGDAYCRRDDERHATFSFSRNAAGLCGVKARKVECKYGNACNFGTFHNS